MALEQPIQFWLNGQIQNLAEGSHHTTLLQWLRSSQTDKASLCGTKEGCAEGDCGACTVLLIEPNTEAQNTPNAPVTLRPINSCIRLLPTLNGKAIVTVEGLSPQRQNTHGVTPIGDLHPAQQAMVHCHGSQCGFCTPGFVMSLAALHKQSPAQALSRQEICDALSGNLCRCTGYRPIIDAAKTMSTLNTQAWHDTSTATNLSDWQSWLRNDSAAPQSLIDFFNAHQAGEKTVQQFAGCTLAQTEQEISNALKQNPEAWILAGGTDVGLWITKALQRNPQVIYIGDVVALQKIIVTDTHLGIRAAVTLDRAFAKLDTYLPNFARIWQRFASVPVRSSGTLCGNVANGSPIGDSMPILIALGAQVELASVEGRRKIDLEDLYLDYKKQSRLPSEWVYAVHVPIQAKPGLKYAAYKLSKRPDQDISAVLAAFAVQVNEQNLITTARIAFGGMAGIPKRAKFAEQALIGANFSQQSFERAATELAKDFAPLTDMRASAQYRTLVAANMFKRFYLEQTQTQAVSLL